MSMCNREHAAQPNWKSGHSELLKTLLRTETEEEAVELGEPWKKTFADLEANNAVPQGSEGCVRRTWAYREGIPEMTMIVVISH